MLANIALKNRATTALPWPAAIILQCFLKLFITAYELCFHCGY